MLREFLDWFDSTPFWKWFASRVIAHFTFRVWGYPTFPMGDYFQIAKLAKPGEFYTFASADNQSLAAKLIRLVIPGKTYFSHAGILRFEEDGQVTAIHMRGEGLRVESLLNLLRECDVFYVGRVALKDGGAEEVKKRIDFLIENRDKIQYDYEQNLDDDDLGVLRRRGSFETLYIFCSELFRKVFQDQVADKVLGSNLVLGRKTFDPDMLLRYTETVYTNHPDLKGN